MTLKTDTTAGAGSQIVATLEAVYDDIRANHAELPEVVFITGSGMAGRRHRWGHFCAGRWATRDGHRPEILIAGERLAAGAELTLQTILHEAVHALAHARGFQDTSRHGKYHNKRFRDLAAEVGLRYDGDGPDSSLGYSAVVLTEEAKAIYAASLRRLGEGIAVWLEAPPPGLKSRTTAADRNNLKATCDCGRIIRLSRSTLDAGPVVCGLCGSEFFEEF